MRQDPKKLIEDFVRVAALAGMPIAAEDIRHESVPAPHKSQTLPRGFSAVYIFSLAADDRIVLKVGKVGPKSNARFTSHHYLPSRAKSTVGASILGATERWPELGITIQLDESNIGAWLFANTARDHFFLKGSQLTHLLEAFLQCRLNPLFEG
jgi:hypothetical protein